MFLVYSPNRQDRVFLEESVAVKFAESSGGKLFPLSEADFQSTCFPVAWLVECSAGKAIFLDRGRAFNYCVSRGGIFTPLYHT